jgi:GntR family transcriptional regulator
MAVKSPSLPIGPISPAASGPLYRQIVEAVTREVASGRMPPGRPLPSLRALAEELQVSLITVKRAYEELERAGVIYRRQGLGTFVAENGTAAVQQAQQALAREAMRHAVTLGRQGGLADAELVRLLEETLRDERGDRR